MTRPTTTATAGPRVHGDPRIELVPLDAILRAPRNPRTHQLDRIDESFGRFGFVMPPLLDERTGRLVAGHGRLDALLERRRSGAAPPARVRLGPDGAWLVPVIRGLSFETPEDAELYLLADNKLTEIGGWDETELGRILAEVGEAEAAIAGFNDDDFARLVQQLESNSGSAIDEPEDAITDPPEEPDSVLGGVYELGPHRVVCGDATVMTDLGKLMGSERAAMVFTDPPYNVAYVGKTKAALTIANDAMSEEDFERFLVDAFATMLAASDPGAPAYVCHADSSGHLFRGSFRKAGWLLKQCLVWVKDTLVLGRQDYHWRHEPILYGWAPGGAHRWFGGRKQTTVWEIARPRVNAEHPTMKPVDLVERALANSSQRRAIVLDPFAGSGTTLIAAARQGRVARLLELDPRFVDVIRRRYTKWAQAAGLEPGPGALGTTQGLGGGGA